MLNINIESLCTRRLQPGGDLNTTPVASPRTLRLSSGCRLFSLFTARQNGCSTGRVMVGKEAVLTWTSVTIMKMATFLRTHRHDVLGEQPRLPCKPRLRVYCTLESQSPKRKPVARDSDSINLPPVLAACLVAPLLHVMWFSGGARGESRENLTDFVPTSLSLNISKGGSANAASGSARAATPPANPPRNCSRDSGDSWLLLRQQNPLHFRARTQWAEVPVCVQ